MQTNEYQGWLVSSSFIKRSLAVFGHYVIGSLIVSIPIFAVMALAMFALGGMVTAP